MALASDTATALENSYGPSGQQPIAVLVTTKDSRMIFPSSIETVVHLKQQEQKEQEQQDDDECQEWKVASDDDDDYYCNNTSADIDNENTNNKQ